MSSCRKSVMEEARVGGRGDGGQFDEVTRFCRQELSLALLVCPILPKT